MPAIPTMLLDIFITSIVILIQQPAIGLSKLASIVANGYVAKTSSTIVNTLLSRGGIGSMMPTVALIVLTLSLGETTSQIQADLSFNGSIKPSFR